MNENFGESDFIEAFGPGNNNKFDGMPPGLPQGMLVLASGGFPGMGMMGTPMITGDEVDYHDTQKMILPKGWTFEHAMTVLKRLHEEAEVETSFDREFNYRPDDGAVATSRVLSRRYGMVLGETLDMGFFGTRPPESKTVTIGLNQKVQVPWGLISLPTPTMKGVRLMLCSHSSEEYGGEVFAIHITAAKKHKSEIEQIFEEIDEELRTNSIYRGKSMVGSDQLEFLDVDAFPADQIVFSEEVTGQLEAGIWAPMRYTEAFRQEGIRTRRTALLCGGYGCGKSSTGLITAQIANANGWTFLAARPGIDDPLEVMRTAKLYMPCVVFIEDVDTKASASDDDEVSRLLDAFDGITAKDGDLLVVMTTNHHDRIHEAMYRPGRLDSVVLIGSLDCVGVERLVKVLVPAPKLGADIDYPALYEAMADFSAAFVREALERAKTFAVSRLKGALNYVLSHEDIIKSAESLRPQLEMLINAKRGEARPTLDSAMNAAIKSAAEHAVHGTKVIYDPHTGGEKLSVPSLNGNQH